MGLLVALGCATEPPPPTPALTVTELTTIPSPTRLAWAPDGRLFVADVRGRITALSFDAAWNETARAPVASREGQESDAILGMAFHPGDGSLWVAHSRLQAGGCEDRAWEFAGGISRLVPPAYDTWEPVVTGLPNGKTSHGVNELLFLPEGDLLVAVGGVTNAGVPSCDLGGLPESPLSAAILRLRIGDPDFDGSVRYRDRDSGLPSHDQRDGQRLVPDTDAWGGVEATGLRNVYGMARTPHGSVYLLDNGPNPGEGDAQRGDSVGPVGDHPDELNRLRAGGYYGHPNPARGELDYHDPSEPAPAGVLAPLAGFPASANAILPVQDRFGVARGLVVLQLDGAAWLQELDDDDLPTGAPRRLSPAFPGLDLVQAPDGALVSADFLRGRLLLAR